MGNVYLYLMDDEVPVCFSVMPAIEFTEPNPKVRWINLKADKSIG
jgi:hypothetical protein